MRKLILSLSVVVLAFMLASCGDDSDGSVGVTAHLKVTSNLPAGTKITEFKEHFNNDSKLVFQYFIDHTGTIINNNAVYAVYAITSGGSEPSIKAAIYHNTTLAWEGIITVKNSDYLKAEKAMKDTLVDSFLNKVDQSYEGSISL